MVGIILAAGMARRLLPYTKKTPKCLLHVGHRNILYYTLKNLINHNIGYVIIVTGFQKKKIEQYVKKISPN